jgi:hypothetical protein
MKTLENPALAALESLVGEWNVAVTKDGQYIPVGIAAFSWIEGKAFLRMYCDTGGKFMPSAVWIICKDPMMEEYHVNYVDDRGVARLYHMSFDGDVWKMWRSEPNFWQRFEAVRNNARWSGQWEQTPNGRDWELDFEISFSKAA